MLELRRQGSQVLYNYKKKDCTGKVDKEDKDTATNGEETSAESDNFLDAFSS